MLRPGGSIVVSHPMGRKWHSGLHERSPDTVPHPLPDDRAEFEHLVHDLPLRVVELVDEGDLYLAVLQVNGRDDAYR